MPTLKEIEAAQTSAGGWTRKQLAEWGVPWPPPRGWKRALAAGLPVAAAIRRQQKRRQVLEGHRG